jgi:hypothetical protein
VTAHQVIATAVRLFAIWLLVLAIQAIGIAQALILQAEMPTSLPYFFAACYLVAAVLLWAFPMLVATRLVPRTKFEGSLGLPAQHVVVVACVVMGLWVIVSRALPSLLSYLALAAAWVGSGQTLSTLGSGRHLEGLVALVMLAVGVSLVLRPEVVARRVSR